jgi:hypothetical protein
MGVAIIRIRRRAAIGLEGVVYRRMGGKGFWRAG